MKYTLIYAVLICSSLFSCKEASQSKQEVSETEVVKEANPGLIPISWVNNRVEKAKKRLDGSEAGKVVWDAMEAMGGLKKWYGNGYLSFRFNYQPLDGSVPRDTYQTIDTWSNKARHRSVTDSTAIYGWDGKNAWVKVKDSTTFKYNLRFWALTPLYLAAQPLVLDGEGVNLELLPQVNYKDTLQDVVKVTFASGTGDAPDDYYILYLDTKTHLLSALRYIVSYPGYFPNGGNNPEKIMDLVSRTTVNGINFPLKFNTYWSTDDGQPKGEPITTIELSDIEFQSQLEENFFEQPEGAKLLEGL
ncbi:hypothetical protein KO529_02450 [Arenibacter algicola]|uniref:hypothetical protein n=1 Tax=Arenibacter algicola TaxID=616991 RepID=UPI001C073C3F|nr:hypothetical protein [Arenibacter algicola]MBU2903633.1 hypothetical protein [Arenibacter algicola]